MKDMEKNMKSCYLNMILLMSGTAKTQSFLILVEYLQESHETRFYKGNGTGHKEKKGMIFGFSDNNCCK